MIDPESQSRVEYMIQHTDPPNDRPKPRVGKPAPLRIEFALVDCFDELGLHFSQLHTTQRLATGLSIGPGVAGKRR